MRITRIEQARRSVASAYAKRTCDDVTLQLIESLERENWELHARASARSSQRGLHTGRRVFGNFIAVVLLIVQGVLIVSWLDDKDDGWSPPAAVGTP